MQAGSQSRRTLGTALRHLLEQLDGDVDAIYAEEGMDYRPRYTPVMRTLARSDGNGLSIRQLATSAGISHSAASQTVARMKRAKLVRQAPGNDGRERVVRLTAHGRALLPKLEARWAATNAAAEELDRELAASLTSVIEEAIASLEAKPFKDRIRAKEKLLARRRAL